MNLNRFSLSVREIISVSLLLSVYLWKYRRVHCSFKSNLDQKPSIKNQVLAEEAIHWRNAKIVKIVDHSAKKLPTVYQRHFYYSIAVRFRKVHQRAHGFCTYLLVKCRFYVFANERWFQCVLVFPESPPSCKCVPSRFGQSRHMWEQADWIMFPLYSW